MTNYLITGGCGFIGTAVVTALIRDPENNIRVFDNLSVGSKKNLTEVSEFFTPTNLDQNWKRVEFVEGDINNFELVKLALTSADVVIHLAANTGVAPSIEDPMMDCLVNVVGTLNVLEACRTNLVSKVILASSGAPLGEQPPPLHEELAPKPMSPYGASKLAAEGYCSAYFHSFGIHTVSLRFGNVYGPGSFQKNSVVAKFLRQVINSESHEIYGDGLQTRDYVYIEDLVEAISLASITPGIGGNVFQIATAKETSLIELVECLSEVLADFDLKMGEIIHSASRVGDAKRNFSDTSKALQLLGWSSKTPLKKGLFETVKYFLNNQ